MAASGMQPVSCADLPLRPLQLSGPGGSQRGARGARQSRRHLRKARMKLKQLASKLGLEFRGDGEIEILMPAPIEAAAPGTLIFVANEKYAPMLQKTQAACVIVPPQFADQARCPVLISANPYFHFARALEIFFPPHRPTAGIDPSARVAPDA